MDNLSNKYKYITDMEVINGKLYWRLGAIVLFFIFIFKTLARNAFKYFGFNYIFSLILVSSHGHHAN